MTTLAHTILNPSAADLPVLLLGPPLGTSAAVWSAVGYKLADDYNVVLLDLPGHGADAANADSIGDDLTVQDIAAGVIEVADEVGAAKFSFAGCSIYGGVGLVLGADHGQRLDSLAILCAGPSFANAASWDERIATVQQDGTAALIPDTADRWFAAGFLDEDEAAGPMTLEMLRNTPDAAYIACCRALRRFDVDDRVGDIDVPTLFLAGAQDTGNSPEKMEELAARVRGSSFAVVPDAAHVCMVEHPEIVTERLQNSLGA